MPNGLLADEFTLYAKTRNFHLLGLMKKHEKTAWMLRSHLGAT